MNIFFMGGKKIGHECLKVLIDFAERKGSIKIVGVLPSSRGEDVKRLAIDNKFKVLDSLEDYLLLEDIDINISVQYHRILKSSHLHKARLNVNLHMAPLPDYRGCNQFTMAILDGKDNFGTTLHVMDTGIDSGDILFERRFDISKKIWVEELYLKTFSESVSLFKDSLEELIAGDYRRVSQGDLIGLRGSSTHYRAEVETLKKIDFGWDREKISRHIRATSMPGFPPPFADLDGKTVLIFEGEKKND